MIPSTIQRALALVAFTTGAGFAQVPQLDEIEQGMRSCLGLLVEHIELADAVAGPLLQLADASPFANELRWAVGEAIEEGSGEIAEMTYLLTHSGQRARIESVLEFIYPTEWDPAELPKKLTGPLLPGTDVIVPSTPTAFQVRPIGNTLEVDPVLMRDGVTVEINIAPETVRFAGEHSYGKGSNRVTTPRMASESSSSSVRGRCGMTTLLAAHPAVGGGRTMLLFVTPHLQVVPPSPEMRAWMEKQIEAAKANPARKENPFENAADDPFGLDSGVADDPFAGDSGVVDDPFAVAPRDDGRPRSTTWSTVMISYEAIETSRDRFAELMDSMDHYANSTKLRDALVADLAAGSATMLASASVQTRSGQRARIDSERELLYGTEFDPPEIPQTLTAPPAGDGSQITVPVSVTAWEKWGEGTNLEVDPVVGSDDSTVELNIAPLFTWLDRELTYGVDEAESIHPIFGSLRVSTAVTLRDGDDLLMGAVTPREPETGAPRRDRMVLLFVRADIIRGPEEKPEDEK